MRWLRIKWCASPEDETAATLFCWVNSERPTSAAKWKPKQIRARHTHTVDGCMQRLCLDLRSDYAIASHEHKQYRCFIRTAHVLHFTTGVCYGLGISSTTWASQLHRGQTQTIREPLSIIVVDTKHGHDTGKHAILDYVTTHFSFPATLSGRKR